MSVQVPGPLLAGANALVVGVANDSSIAYGCAVKLRACLPSRPAPVRASTR